MAGNVLSAQINVTAPGVQQTFASVAQGAANASRSLTTLSQQVSRFGGGVASFAPNLAAARNGLASIVPAATRATASLSRLPQAANQSTQALGNLSRVVQDAPFGFLGIANNLNPLLESFQRLRATTGSNALALRALGSSLLGAGGIGFALSAVSSLLIVFGDKIFGGGKKAKETADALKELIKPIEDISNAAGAEVEGSIAKVQALSNAVLDQTNSYKERNNALNQLKEINKSYFGDLTVETAALGLLAARVNEYTQALVNQAVIKAFSEEIGKVSVELAKQEKEARKLAVAVDEAKKKTFETGKVNNTYGGQISVITGSLGKQANAVFEATKAFDKQVKVVGSLQTQMHELRDSINQAVDQSLKFRPLEETKVKKIKEVKFEFDALKAIFKDLVAIQKEFSFQLEQDIKVRTNIKLDLANTDLRANAGSAFDDFSKQLPAISSQLQKEVDRLTKGNVILKLGAQFELDMAAANAQIRKDLAGLNSTFRETITDVFSGIGETIGEALSGGSFQKGLQAVFGIIASGIQAIGKQFIRIGTLALLAKTAFDKLFSNPALSIAVGVALVAAGSALKNVLTGGISGARALGGPVRKGGTYLVGEHGPELFTPDTGGKIISNSALKASGGISSSGGMAVQVVGQLLLRGNDLVAALANANRSQGRLT